MTARTIATSICRPLARPVAGAGDGGAWTPDQLTNVLQRMDSFAYAASNIGGLPAVESSVGTAAVPRGQRCYLADGVDDFIAVASLTGSETVVSKQGTSTVTIAAGRINLTAGTVWEIVLSNGSTYYCNEESGTTAYDSSGNGRHGTITNATLATFHSTSTSVLRNYANDRGYTLSGAVVIPRNEAVPSQDAAGGSLQFSGPIKLNATMEVPCVTFSGSDYAVGPLNRQSGELTLACWFRPDSASGTQALFSNIGDAGGSLLDYQLEFNRTAGRIGLLRNTSVVPGVQSASSLITGVWYHIAGVISGTAGNWTLQLYINGVLDATATVNSNASGNASSAITLGRPGAFNGQFLIGRMSAACLYSVAKNASEIQAIMRGAVDLNGAVGIWPIQAGPGSSNTNRTIHDVSGNGNHLTVTNGTVATQWANRTNVVRDWCIENGGSIAANGAFVPGRIGSSLDAAGNAKGIAAGTHGNPYSRFVPNFWSAPSLVNIGSDASDLYSPSGMAGVQAESTADTRYANTRRYLAVRSALTGSDKTNAQGWVA